MLFSHLIKAANAHNMGKTWSARYLGALAMVMNAETGAIWFKGEAGKSPAGVRAFEAQDIGALCTWFGLIKRI